MGDLGKLNGAKGFKNLPKVQEIAQSGHTVPELTSISSRTFTSRQRRNRKSFFKWAIPGLFFFIFVLTVYR